MDDDARRRIFARRAQFIAAAMAGVGAASAEGCRQKPDGQSTDAEIVAEPRACLKNAVDRGYELTREPDATALPLVGDAHVVSGGVSVSAAAGGAAVADVDLVLARNRWRFKACYNKALATDATTAGIATFKVTVDSSGNVETAATSEKSTIPTTLLACIAGTFRSMKFSEPTGGAATFSVTIDFAPTR